MRPVQARAPVHNHPRVLGREPVLPRQDGVPQVAHHDDRGITLHPAVLQRMGDTGRESVQPAAAP